MNKKQIQIIDCFTQLMVYTLEFKENSQQETYTTDKLVKDYETLINQARETFDEYNMQTDFQEALFSIVSWIDEVVLSSEFKDKKSWRKHLLQKKFFNTSNAGYEFFDKLNALPSEAFDLRLLYLYCLFLGFKGKYYKEEDKESLEDVFKTQKALVHDSFPENFPKLAFKDAYALNPLPQKKKFRASYKGLWIVISVSLLSALVLFLSLQAHLNGLLNKYNIF
jgi:type VI secretion system protein ImpK